MFYVSYPYHSYCYNLIAYLDMSMILTMKINHSNTSLNKVMFSFFDVILFNRKIEQNKRDEFKLLLLWSDKSTTMIKKITSFFLHIFKVCLLKTCLAKIWALILIQRLFTFSVILDFTVRRYLRSKLTDWSSEGWI